MFSRFRTALLVFCPIVLAMVTMASETSPHPYLALGDSVVFGFIDQAGFEYVNPENFVGFPDYVALGLRLSADSTTNMPGRKWLHEQHVLFSVRTLVSQEKRLSRRISILSIRPTLLPASKTMTKPMKISDS